MFGSAFKISDCVCWQLEPIFTRRDVNYIFHGIMFSGKAVDFLLTDQALSNAM